MIGTDLLNDLFTNNIEFAAKQLQTIVDALFPNNEDNSETQFGTNPCILSGQINCVIDSVNSGGWKNVTGYYNFNYSSDIGDAIITFAEYSDNYDDSVHSLVTKSKEFYFRDLENNIGLPHILKHYSGSSYYIVNNSNANYNMNFGQTGVFDKTHNGYVYFDNDQVSLYSAYSSYSISFINGSKPFIITDKNSAEYIYNNNYFNDNDYHNSMTVNNIYVGGGTGGIAVGLPIGGLFNYNELTFALDSLIDDLNLNLSVGNKLPIDHFPTYDEIKYEDMGSFYITPIQQIDTLPEAPDVGDTYPDFSDYLSIVGGAVTSFYNMIDGLGVSLMLVFTFLICLVINHLKKE